VARPMRTEYETDEPVQLLVKVPPELKLAMHDVAASNGRRLSEEIRTSLRAWIFVHTEDAMES
jgi:hypothetical protein